MRGSLPLEEGLGSLVLIHLLEMLMSKKIHLQGHSHPSQVFGGGVSQIDVAAKVEEQEVGIPSF